MRTACQDTGSSNGLLHELGQNAHRGTRHQVLAISAEHERRHGRAILSQSKVHGVPKKFQEHGHDPSSSALSLDIQRRRFNPRHGHRSAPTIHQDACKAYSACAVPHPGKQSRNKLSVGDVYSIMKSVEHGDAVILAKSTEAAKACDTRRSYSNCNPRTRARSTGPWSRIRA